MTSKNSTSPVGFYISDFIAEGKFIVEIKAFVTSHQKYPVQVITYLNRTRLLAGLLINFGERSLRWRKP